MDNITNIKAALQKYNSKDYEPNNEALGFNNLSDIPVITMYGFIDEYEVSAQAVSDALKQVEGDKVEVRINSYGGSVYEGLAIYNLLVNSGLEIIMYVDGIAASIASVILMAGDTRIVAESSDIMIHKAWTFAIGNSDDLLKTVDELEEIDLKINKVLVDRTGLSAELIKAMMEAETMMNSEEALKSGFADSILPNKRADLTITPSTTEGDNEVLEVADEDNKAIMALITNIKGEL